MKETEFKNCYDLYQEKFDKSIKDGLEQTIRESQQEIDLKLEFFIKRNFKNPIPEESSRSEIILKEVVNSKNYLLNLFSSPYMFLYLKHKEDVVELARGITWYWLSLSKPAIPLPDHFKYQKLKEELISIGYHYSIYYGNDRFLTIIEENDPTLSWPKKEHLELYQIKQLEKKLVRQKEHYENLKSREKEYLEKQDAVYERSREELRKKEEELEQLKDKLYPCQSELKLLKENFFFHEDSLFENYVFGDLLPELKSVYNLLREHKLYNSNWGLFCYCLTWYNSVSPNSPQKKLTLNIQNSDLTADDLGYILHILKNHYLYESQLPYINWVMSNTEIISGHGKKFERKDYIKFNEKSIRSYKSGKSLPKNHEEIRQKLQLLI